MSKELKMYFCQNCGPFIKIMKEFWARESDGPFKIEFIQHADHVAVVVDEVEIKTRPEGEVIEYNYCGHCEQLISKDIPISWASPEQMIKHQQSKNKNTKNS